MRNSSVGICEIYEYVYIYMCITRMNESHATNK